LESETLGIPDAKYPTTLKMASGAFVKYCKELSVMSESVKVHIENKIAELSYTSKNGSGKIKLKKNSAEKEDDYIDISCEEVVTASYGLQYLNSFAKASSLSSYVTLSFSTEFPLRIEYDIEIMGFLKFYLAPKMDEDDNNN
jgi:proliferating cell nuclear antigen